MSITIPQRNVIPRGASNSPRMSNAGKAVGNAWERFGRTLSDTAEGLGEMFTQMEIARNKQLLAKAQTDYQEAEAQKLLELEQDTDYEGRIDKYKTWADTQTTAITSGIKRKAVSDEFSNWLRGHRVSTETSIGLNSLQAQRRAILTDAPILQQTWIKNGDKVANDNYANDVLSKFLTPAQIDEYKNDYETGRAKLLNFQTKKAILESVYPIMKEQGLSAAEDTLRTLAEQSPYITDKVNDIGQMLTDLRGAKMREDTAKKNEELGVAKFGVGKLLTNELRIDDIIDKGVKDKDTIKAWEGWIKGANQPAPKQGTLYGADEMQSIILGVASGEIQTLEAYYALNTLRYGGETAVVDKKGKTVNTPISLGQITPAMYNFAIHQIENPMSKYDALRVRELLTENRKSQTGGDNEKSESDFSILQELSEAADKKEFDDVLKKQTEEVKNRQVKKFLSQEFVNKPGGGPVYRNIVPPKPLKAPVFPTPDTVINTNPVTIAEFERVYKLLKENQGKAVAQMYYEKWYNSVK